MIVAFLKLERAIAEVTVLVASSLRRENGSSTSLRRENDSSTWNCIDDYCHHYCWIVKEEMSVNLCDLQSFVYFVHLDIYRSLWW